MDKADQVINFNDIVGEIEEDKILLPDFQRKFSWKTKEQQAKLAASVLCRMPIGSILLLDLPASEYASRRIGCDSPEDFIELDSWEKRQYLLDGQQRITVMVNAFSNLIHERQGKQIKALKRRFFLGIPKEENREKYQKDIWGLRWLNFPLQNPKLDSPDFYTDDIKETLFIEDFTNAGKTPCHPDFPCKTEELLAYCIGREDYYLIPLYLLVQRREKSLRTGNERLLTSILNTIAASRKNDLLNEYAAQETLEKQEQWLGQLTGLEEQVENLRTAEGALEEWLGVLQETWVKDMKDYLQFCIEKMNLHIMGVPNSSREKAIEIFENMNIGGVKLSTFDLVMARAARNNHHFARDLENECRKDRSYSQQNVPDRLRSYCEKYIKLKKEKDGVYNALLDTGCMDEEGEFSKTFQESFLNVLSLQCGRSKQAERNFGEEMRRERILSLASEEINANYVVCCEAMDRAAFFLKARCGIRSIKEIRYQLMYTVLAYVFLEEKNYRKREVWNLLTAWYWCVIFSGGYDKDQNAQAVRDILHLTEIIRKGKDSGKYIDALYKKAWNASDFSDLDFLLYKKSTATGNYPKEALGQYLCQFYLADVYSDLFDAQVGICTFPIQQTAMELEKHHIIPKSSFQTIKETELWLKTVRGKNTIVNSPLNIAYISRTANQKIAYCDFASYVKHLQRGTAFALDFPPDGPALAEKSMEEILSYRFEKIKGKLEQLKNSYMLEWQ